jgi:hypothetical protein
MLGEKAFTVTRAARDSLEIDGKQRGARQLRASRSASGLELTSALP